RHRRRAPCRAGRRTRPGVAARGDPLMARRPRTWRTWRPWRRSRVGGAPPLGRTTHAAGPDELNAAIAPLDPTLLGPPAAGRWAAYPWFSSGPPWHTWS